MITPALLKDAGRAGLRRLPAQSDLSSLAEAAGCRTFTVDLSDAASLKQVLASLATSLGFPDWFGHNLDALMDCLTDLSWCPAEAYALLLTGTRTLAAARLGELESLLEVLACASATWREEGIPFWILADLPGLPEAA